jgi:hypothetical protein
MDSMKTQNFFIPSNFMREKEGSPLILITDPDRNPSQIGLKGRTERSREDDSEIEPLPSYRSADPGIFQKRSNPALLLKGDDFIHEGRGLPKINQMIWNKYSQTRVRKQFFHPLNRWIGENRIPYPVYSPHQNTIHLAEIRFQHTSFPCSKGDRPEICPLLIFYLKIFYLFLKVNPSTPDYKYWDSFRVDPERCFCILFSNVRLGAVKRANNKIFSSSDR